MARLIIGPFGLLKTARTFSTGVPGLKMFGSKFGTRSHGEDFACAHVE